MSKTIKSFVIVDDKQEEIEKFETAIATIPNCTLIHRAINETQLFDFLEKNSTKVDYVIADLKFGNNYKIGYRIVDKINKEYPSIITIIWSEYPDKSYLQKVIFKETAKGFLDKSRIDFKFNLRRAIDTIENGGEFWEIAMKYNLTINAKHYDRRVRIRLQKEKHCLLSKNERAATNPSNLKTSLKEVKAYRYQYGFQDEYDISPQRWLIFKKVALGYSTKEIADFLDTEKATINTQKNKIREQLEIDGQGDVWFLIKAMEFGLEEVIDFLEKTVKVSIIKH